MIEEVKVRRSRIAWSLPVGGAVGGEIEVDGVLQVGSFDDEDGLWVDAGSWSGHGGSGAGRGRRRGLLEAALRCFGCRRRSWPGDAVAVGVLESVGRRIWWSPAHLRR